MDKWEYLSIIIVYLADEQKWEGRVGTGAMRADYIHELVNPLGQEGWEMISLVPETHQQAGSHANGAFVVVTAWDAIRYRAVFKRRLP